jgi:hypothetical protein
MQQPSGPAAAQLVTETVRQVLQQLGLQGLPAAHTLPAAQASGIPPAPPAAAQPALPGQVDIATMAWMQQQNMAMLAQQQAAMARAAAPVYAAQPAFPGQVDIATMAWMQQQNMAMLAQQQAAMARAVAPVYAAQPAFPGQVDMQHTTAMGSPQQAARARAAAPATAARQHIVLVKQPAYKAFRLEGKETCSQLYTIVQYGINGFPSWRQHKAEAEAQGIPLHPTDRHQFSKYQPIIMAVQFAMQRSGMTEDQALQALDSMQQQLASHGSSQQRQKVGVSDIAYGFAYVHNLDTQIKALAQQRATGGKLHLPPSPFEPKAMKAHGSSTTIRSDMQQSRTGITVWEFIQHAAALNLCPQRAKEEWFAQCVPSMQTQAPPRKRGLDQE